VIDQAKLNGEKVSGISPRMTPRRENRLFSQLPLKKMAKSLARMEWNVPKMEIPGLRTSLTHVNNCQGDRSSEFDRRKSVWDKPEDDSSSRKSTFSQLPLRKMAKSLAKMKWKAPRMEVFWGVLGCFGVFWVFLLGFLAVLGVLKFLKKKYRLYFF
jgi:hypothetical protein